MSHHWALTPETAVLLARADAAIRDCEILKDELRAWRLHTAEQIIRLRHSHANFLPPARIIYPSEASTMAAY